MNLLDIFFPKCCVGCGNVGRYFCRQCTSIIQIIEVNESICPVCEKPAIDGRTHPRCQSRYSLDGLTSFFRYDGLIRKAVKAIKYRYISDLASEFVSLVPRSFFDELTKLPSSETSFLIPIPLHSSRYRFRGFNQAEVLGAHVAQKLNLTMRTDILKRIKKTTPQVEMKYRDERLKNMEEVFALHDACRMTHDAVFLFDDVFTTGATMRSAGNVLKRNGAKFVWAVTMAR